MDEVSSHVRLDLPLIRRQGRVKDCSTLSSNPMMEGPWCRFRREARARERHRYCAGGESESLKALDPKRPIREADVRGSPRDVADVPRRHGAYDYALAGALATLRACSMKSRARGLSVRLLSVMIPICRCVVGSSTGSTFSNGCLAGNRRMPEGTTARSRPVAA